MTGKRKQKSFGTCFHNEGTCMEQKEEKFVLDNTRDYYVFDIIPFGAPRMSQRDRYYLDPYHKDPRKRQREVVTKYFEYKNTLVAQAEQMGFVLKDCMEAVYCMPMPDSWSTKKKERMNGMPHRVRPDTDNITKGIKDTLREEDGSIWDEGAKKVWAWRGSIILFG